MPSPKFLAIFSRARGLATNTILTTRAYHSKSTRRTARDELFSRISPLGDPNISLIPVLDKWIEEGKNIKGYDLQGIVKELRSRKRYTHALQVSEWTGDKGLCRLSPADRAVQLNLIGRVRGLESAETYFQNLDHEDKSEKTYGALLNCYVRECLVDKFLAHLQKMKELGFATHHLCYNHLMCLYKHTGQLEKVPDVLLEMKENGVSPDIFSYRICMQSYGARSDFCGMEKTLEEMENQPHLSIDWITYSSAANIYIKAGLEEKAMVCLKKCENKVDKDPMGYNHLMSLYASIGNKDEIMRLWGLTKAKLKRQFNRDYITMLDCLLKLGELEEMEKLVQEWESSGNIYDIRVPTVLLNGYCRMGSIEKAEAILRDIAKRQKTVTPNCWSIIAAGYVNKLNMEKAFECMKEALSLYSEKNKWQPKSYLVSSILSWLGDNGNVEDVESFVRLLEAAKVPKDREMYHTLIKACIRGGKPVDELLESMKADNIDVDEETKTILSSRQEE